MSATLECGADKETVHGRSAVMLRTGVVVVRRTTRDSASSSSMASVDVGDRNGEGLSRVDAASGGGFCSQTAMTPMALAGAAPESARRTGSWWTRVSRIAEVAGKVALADDPLHCGRVPQRARAYWATV